ncbi:MAG: DUF433 domain-containing protein [Desulfuromonadales bacterium]
MHPHIQINPRICNGKPVIAGTRIPVTVIVDQIIAAGSLENLNALYPELDRQQIIAALQYCHTVIDHTEFESLAA